MALESRPETELHLPKDLLAEVQRHTPTRRGDFKVEGWKPSLAAKLFGLFDRERSRE